MDKTVLRRVEEAVVDGISHSLQNIPECQPCLPGPPLSNSPSAKASLSAQDEFLCFSHF